MQCRSTLLSILAATIFMPALLLAEAAWAQPVDRPVSDIAPYDSRSVMAPALPPPVITRALLPGHWALHGARYVWVPPETTPRPVRSAEVLPGAYVWRNGAYVWVPTHPAN